MAEPIIQVANVFKSFKVSDQLVPVLHDINVEIKDGDFTIIYGPSGCGKSTLLHILLGLEPPTSGQVSIFGIDVYQADENNLSNLRRNHIGMIYQQPNWIKSLNVLENVGFPLLLVGNNQQVANERAFKLLDKVGMRDWAYYAPTELSGGQQQRIALARALITNPMMIIADEPTGNLDYKSGQEMMEFMVQLNKQHHKTIVMVTHDLQYLKQAKSAVEMLDGRIVQFYANVKKSKAYETITKKQLAT